MILFAGLTEEAWPRIWAFNKLESNMYEEEALSSDLPVYCIYQDEMLKSILGPYDNFYIEPLHYYNCWNHKIVDGIDVFDTDGDEFTITKEDQTSKRGNRKIGRYKVLSVPYSEVLEKELWRGVQKELCYFSTANILILVAELGRRIADTVIFRSQILQVPVDQVLESEWYKDVLAYVTYQCVRKMNTDVQMRFVKNEQFSEIDSVKTKGRNLNQIVFTKALDELQLELMPVIENVLNNPSDLFLVDEGNRNLNSKCMPAKQQDRAHDFVASLFDYSY